MQFYSICTRIVQLGSRVFIASIFPMCERLARCRAGALAVNLIVQLVFSVFLLVALQLSSVHAQSVAPGAVVAQKAPDTMAARVLGCASCHGAQGEGTSDVYFPRLAGKPAGYLYNQLIAFRDGRRRYPPMNFLLEFLPDPYLKEIAEYFASLRPPFPPPGVSEASNEVLARGESQVRNGDSQHGVPPCSACHGPTLGGMEPAIPGLLG